jgi:hypothetical protein
MPRPMTAEDKREIEESILPAGEVGKHDWPLRVDAMGETAALRLIRGKARISYDWVVPERLQEAVTQARITRQVPAPEGTATQSAIQWTQEWLREQVISAEMALRNGGVVRDRDVLNDVPLSRLVDRFRASEKMADLRRRSPAGADEIERWLDFYVATLGAQWRLYQMSPDVLRKLHTAFQKPWFRTLPDGSAIAMNTSSRAGHNTAAKVVRYLKTVCQWGLSEPDGPGTYLLDVDPFQRIRARDIPRERDSESRPVGVASDDFARAMYRRGVDRGEHGQFGLLFAGEASTGRRVGEWREARRSSVLTDFEDVRRALEEQACRRVLPDRHIPDEELEEAARAYLELSGVVMWFRFQSGKQAAQNPDQAAQHDRVIPLGPWIGGVVLDYLRDHWEPRGLPPHAPLCAAAQDPTKPTHKDLVQTWWERTEAVVMEKDDVRIPAGRTHTLRRRVRDRLRTEDDKAVAFYAGWTLTRTAARDRSYLPVKWRDVVTVAHVADRDLALR